MAVQWLRLHLPMWGVQVRSLVGEPRSHMTHDQKTKTENRNNIITNSINTLKKSLKKTNMDPVFDHMVRAIVAGKIFLKK